jgi:hypothetical protein
LVQVERSWAHHGLLDDERQRRLLLLAQSAPLASAAAGPGELVDTVPAGATSVGMGISGGAGAVTMDDFAMSDNAPAPDVTAPTSTLDCNGVGGDGNGCAATNGWFNGPVEIDLSASDDAGGSGLARIVYTLDGSTPSATNGSTYTGPFSVSQTTTVKYLAIDGRRHPVAAHASWSRSTYAPERDDRLQQPPAGQALSTTPSR